MSDYRFGQRGWYSNVGSVELQWPHLGRLLPCARVRRNGRCLELEAGVGDLWFSVALYRCWSDG